MTNPTLTGGKLKTFSKIWNETRVYTPLILMKSSAQILS